MMPDNVRSIMAASAQLEDIPLSGAKWPGAVLSVVDPP
jgi:hypothetical protein